jgi:hypothetical protein
MWDKHVSSITPTMHGTTYSLLTFPRHLAMSANTPQPKYSRVYVA